ncbi:oligosaccharide flippase family protein [Brevibacillus sp. B_LB10_24]|uniref:oligosaccharide flippase family protein n=1 Tax=Brevibacillus sp. B_LB10_24 TaxID=3380645 RepID=UPI0038BC064C
MLKRTSQTSFVRNTLILVSGTAIAQLIPILISPVLTRMYSPEDFGTLAVFMALTSTFGVIANGRYELAVILPDKDEEAAHVAAVGAVVAVILGILLLAVTLFFHDSIVSYLNDDRLGIWLYLFPASVVLIGVNSVLIHFNLRYKNYKNIAHSNVSRSFTQALVQIVVGCFKTGEAGLVSGQFLSYAAGNYTLLKQVCLNKELFSSVKLTELIRLGKKYKGFPLFSVWARLANSLAQNLVNIVFSALYSTAALGFYTLVNRMLGLPTSVIGESMGQVFTREARDEIERSGSATNILRSTLWRLTAISLPVFLLIYFFIEDVVVLVFGQNWKVAGVYGQILIPLFFIRFITVPVMDLLNLFEKQRISLLWQLGFLGLVATVSIIAKRAVLDAGHFLSLMTWVLFAHYVLLLFILFHVSRGNKMEKKMKNCCCLVLGGYINGYSIIRELYEKGIRDIVLFDTQKRLAAYSNKIVSFVRIEPAAESLHQALENLHQKYEKIIVYPTDEIQLEMLDEQYEQISGYCFLPYNHDNLQQYINKIEQYKHCEKAEIPYPNSRYIETEERYHQILDIPFPVVVKPAKRDHAGPEVFRSLIFHSHRDFERHEELVRSFLARGIPFIASEIIPGDASQIYSYIGYRNRHGTILNEWTGRKLSSYPDNFGVFSCATNQAPAEVVQLGRKLLESMDLHGICEPEFKYDARDGTYKLMEVSLRSTMWNRVGHLSGVDILYTQYRDAIGEENIRQEQDQSKQIHFVYLQYELLGLFRGAIPFKTLWRNLFSSDKTAFAVFDLTDVKPFAADCANLLTGVVSKGGRLLFWTKQRLPMRSYAIGGEDGNRPGHR